MRNIFFFAILFSSVSLHAQKFEGLAKTPPMGWNSWNKFACNVDEKMIREMKMEILFPTRYAFLQV